MTAADGQAGKLGCTIGEPTEPAATGHDIANCSDVLESKPHKTMRLAFGAQLQDQQGQIRQMS